jgi:hypothetical protein
MRILRGRSSAGLLALAAALSSCTGASSPGSSPSPRPTSSAPSTAGGIVVTGAASTSVIAPGTCAILPGTVVRLVFSGAHSPAGDFGLSFSVPAYNGRGPYTLQPPASVGLVHVAGAVTESYALETGKLEVTDASPSGLAGTLDVRLKPGAVHAAGAWKCALAGLAGAASPSH